MKTKQLANVFAHRAAALAVFVLFAFAAAADTIYVPSGYLTIGDALAEAKSGDTVEVDEGTYSVSETISIPAGVTVIAPKGPEKTEIKSTGTQDDVVLVDGVDAKLVGFAVSDAKGKRAVHVVNDGAVSNCVIRNSTFTPNNDRLAVWVEKGTLARSVVTNNSISGSVFEWTKGSAVRLKSGLVDSCVITHNSSANSRSSVKQYHFGGAVYLEGGTLRNSLVADNYSQYNAMGVYMAAVATIDGCTIGGNCNLDSTDADSVGLTMAAAGTVVNTIIWGNENKNGVANVKKSKGTMTYSCTTPLVSGTDNISEDPNFADADAGDYRLGYGPAIDKATPRDWHDGALDLDGESRVFGDGPDMGCYESHSRDLGCGFSVDVTVGPAPLQVTVTGSCSAGIEGATFKWYFTGADEPDVTTTGEATAEWTYDDLGVHDIRLVVENGGASGSTTKPGAVTVGPAVCYVDAANAGHSVAPYTNLATAAENISEAVACAVKGTVISVARGTYPQAETITLSPGVTMIAPEGPEETEIRSQGTQDDVVFVDGANLIGFAVSDAKGRRAVRIDRDGVVSNCVVRNSTFSPSEERVAVRIEKGTLVRSVVTNTIISSSAALTAWTKGSAVRLVSGLVDSCVIARNSSGNPNPSAIQWHFGGAVYLEGGTLRNTLVADNYSQFNAMGVYMAAAATIDGCTIAGNCNRDSADAGSAGLRMTAGCTVINTITWGNANKNGVANVKKDGGTMTYSCTTPLISGAGNTSEDPNFVDAGTGDYRLGFGSAIDTATPRDWHEGSLDLGGESRVFGDGPDMGCYESHSRDLGCGFSVDVTVGPAPLKVTVTGTCSAGIEGTTFKWYFAGGDEPNVTKTGEATAEWTYTGLGVHDIRLEVENDGATGTKALSGAVTVGPAVCYVDAANAGHAVAPYTSPETAATNISEAIACAKRGTVIRVAEGTYPQTQTVVLNDSATLIGAGADKVTLTMETLIGDPKTLVRIASDGAVVSGLTLSGGGSSGLKVEGGTVSNCVIRNARAVYRGGGVYLTGNSKLYGCIVTNNTVDSGNVWAMGGGVYADGDQTVVENCTVLNNRSSSSAPNAADAGGAGVWANGGLVRNCLVAGNSDIAGAAVFLKNATMDNCTVVDNFSAAGMPAPKSGATDYRWLGVGGVSALGASKIRNSIVYGNCAKTPGAVTNLVFQGSSVTVSHSLVGEPGDEEPFAGLGNVLYQDPIFKNAVRGNYRLQAKSPCVGKGDASVFPDVSSARDLDGKPRFFNRALDLGCYENHSAGLILQVQ